MTPPSKAPRYANRYVKMYRTGVRLTVDDGPTVRKVQALRRIGHTNERIANGTGVGNKQFIGAIANGNRSRSRVRLATARRIDSYYADNWDNPLSDPNAQKSITAAVKRGWLAPVEYEDIEKGIVA